MYLALMILIQLAIGSLWLKLLTKMDRNRKKKNTEAVFPLLFAFGMLSAGIAVAVYRILPPWLGLSGSYLIDNFLTNLIMVGPAEELCKFFVFYLIVSKLDSIRESTDGLLQGATVGLAFAVRRAYYVWLREKNLI
jgi:RsiW-degrading membrane proteinase PrsW (M82 family)